MSQEMFNWKTKEDFLSGYNDATQIYYRRIFTKSAEFEKENRKDVANFNTEEIRLFLKSLHPETAEASRTNGRVVSAYLNWSVKNGLRKTGTNPLLNLDMDWYNQFSVDVLSLYITKQQLEAMETWTSNYQDFSIVALLWDGIEGKEASEIRYLKKTDIIEDESSLWIFRDGVRQKFKISPLTLRSVIKSSQEREYMKLNGEASLEGVNSSPFVDLIDSDFVLRNARTKAYSRSGNEPVSRNTLYRRLNLIRERFENGSCEFLRAKNVKKSGMAYLAWQMSKNGTVELTRGDYEKIAERYGLHKRDFWRVAEWCSSSILQGLYGTVSYSDSNKELFVQ